MARVSNVELRLESADIFSVSVNVDFTIEFTAEEAAARDRFRVQAELWADDTGEQPANVIPLLLGPLYIFSFGVVLRRRDFMVVTAVGAPVTRTIRAVVGRAVLDEDPGTDAVVIGHKRFDPNNPEEDLDITVQSPQIDEIYALIRLNPHGPTSGRSESRNVPERFTFR